MKSAAEYFTEFIKYTKNIKQNKKTLQYIYKRDLKKEIKNKIIYYKYYMDTNNQINIL